MIWIEKLVTLMQELISIVVMVSVGDGGAYRGWRVCKVPDRKHYSGSLWIGIRFDLN